MSMELTKQRVDDTIINYFASRNKTKADKRHAFNTYCDFLKSNCKKFTEFAEKNSVDLRGYKSVSALNSAGHKNYENIKEMLDGQEFLQFVDNESRIVRGGEKKIPCSRRRPWRTCSLGWAKSWANLTDCLPLSAA